MNEFSYTVSQNESTDVAPKLVPAVFREFRKIKEISNGAELVPFQERVSQQIGNKFSKQIGQTNWPNKLGKQIVQTKRGREIVEQKMWLDLYLQFLES